MKNGRLVMVGLVIVVKVCEVERELELRVDIEEGKPWRRTSDRRKRKEKNCKVVLLKKNKEKEIGKYQVDMKE